jgi:transcriptional regulator with XRE-family HTH domain
MLDAKVVGKVIQQFREKKGLSQDVLSGLAGIGRTHLSAIERAERKPTLETFYKLSIALNVKSSELFKAIEEEMTD